MTEREARFGVPSFVPGHLSGRVADFRNEPNGNVSFFDSNAATSDPRGYYDDKTMTRRIAMSPTDYKSTFDRSSMLMNMGKSVDTMYAAPNTRTRGIQDILTDVLRGGLDKVTATPARTMATAGVLGALGTGLAGYQAAKNFDMDAPGTGILASLLGGALGAGGVYMAQRNARSHDLTKQASTAADILLASIMSDPNLSTMQRQMTLQALMRVNNQDAEQLATAVRTAGGGAAGMLIMQFLAGKGLIPALFGGALGAIIGRMTGSQPRKNAFGQS